MTEASLAMVDGHGEGRGVESGRGGGRRVQARRIWRFKGGK
jgi:hypothetical protein